LPTRSTFNAVVRFVIASYMAFSQVDGFQATTHLQKTYYDGFFVSIKISCSTIWIQKSNDTVTVGQKNGTPSLNHKEVAMIDPWVR
jgi:hypothetical protein